MGESRKLESQQKKTISIEKEKVAETQELEQKWLLQESKIREQGRNLAKTRQSNASLRSSNESLEAAVMALSMERDEWDALKAKSDEEVALLERRITIQQSEMQEQQETLCSVKKEKEELMKSLEDRTQAELEWLNALEGAETRILTQSSEMREQKEVIEKLKQKEEVWKSRDSRAKTELEESNRAKTVELKEALEKSKVEEDNRRTLET